MSKEIPSKVIVRVRDSYYSRSKGCVVKTREIYVLKKQSEGYDFFSEEISMIGADLVIQMITNFYEVEPGIYEVIICNIQKDWETGLIDSYEFTLTVWGKTE